MIPSSEIRRRLRETLSLFPTGVTVVSVRNPDGGAVRGMTANAFMSVSLDPPLIVVSVRNAARLHGWLRSIGGYGVSFLGDSLAQEARRFASSSTEPGDDGPGFELHDGVPVLRGAMAWLTATIVDEHLAGDHTLFIGRVVDFDAGATGEQSPLCFYRSRFAQVAPLAAAAPLDSWNYVDAWG